MSWNDPDFRYGQVLMPMTVRELDAIADLRTANLTLSEAFPPERRAGRFIGFLDPEIPGQLHWPVVMGYRFRFRYNRVDGLLSSVGNELDLFSGIRMSWRLGQATGLEQTRSYVSLARPLGEQVLFRISRERDVASQGAWSGHSEALASVQAALGGQDYFDYFLRTRYGAGMEATWRGLHLTAGVEQEKAESIDRQVSPFLAVCTDLSGQSARSGRHVPVGVRGSLALPRRTTRTIRSAALRVEHGSPQRLAGDAAFTLLGGHIDLAQPTLHRHRPASAGLHIRLQGGTSFGDLPPQRTALLDTGLELFDALRLNRRHAFRSLARTAVAGGAPRRCLLAPRLHDAPVRMGPAVAACPPAHGDYAVRGPRARPGTACRASVTKGFPASPRGIAGIMFFTRSVSP